MLSTGSPQTVQVERDLETGVERLVTNPLFEQYPGKNWRKSDALRNRPDYRWRFFHKAGGRIVNRFDLTTRQTDSFFEAARNIEELGISPNGDYLNIRTRGLKRGQFDLWLINLANKHVRHVATTAPNGVVTWSKDGRELAFPNMDCLMVMAPEDPEPTKLTCATAPDLPENIDHWGRLLQRLWSARQMGAAWKEDGTKLLWRIPVLEHQRVELLAVDRASGEHEVILAGDKDYYTIPFGGAWSPDGKWLFTNILSYPDQEIRPIPNVLARLRAARPQWTVSSTD